MQKFFLTLKQHHLLILAGVLTLISLGSCSTAATTDAQGPSLREAAEKWATAINTGNVAGITASFAQDVMAMYPNSLPTLGRDANEEAWTKVYSSPNNTQPVTVDRVEVAKSGELGYIFGKWWSIKPDSDYRSGGRYMAVWSIIDGQWQIEMLSANTHEDIAAQTPPDHD